MAARGRLADDLHRFREGRPTRARPVGTIGRAARWARRRPAVTALFGACAAMAVVAVYLVGLLAVQRFRHAQEIDLVGRGRELQEFHATFWGVRTRRLEQQGNWADDNRADLQRLAAMAPAGDNLPALRSEAAVALAAPRLQLVRELAVGKNAYVCAFSPDGDTLALGEHYPTPDSVLRVWLVRTTGEAVGELTYKADEAWEKRNKRADGARSLAYSPDRRWLVLGTRGGRLVRWDLRENLPKPIAWGHHAGVGTDYTRDEVRALLFNRDGSVLASGGNYVSRVTRRWDVRREWAELDGSLMLLPIGIPLVGESAVIESTVAGCNLHEVDLRTGQLGQAIPSTGFGSFTQSREGGRVATTTGRTIVSNWLGRVGHPMEHLLLRNPARFIDSDQSADLAFESGGRWLYSTTKNRGGLVLWDTTGATPATAARIRGDSGRLAVSPAGPLVAVCDEKGTLLFERQDSPVRRDLAEAGTVLTFALSADGERLVTVGAPTLPGNSDVEERAPRVLYARAGRGFRWHRQQSVDVTGNRTSLVALGSTRKGAELVSSGRVIGAAGLVTLEGTGIETGHLNDLQFGPDGVIWAASVKEKLLSWPREGGLKVVATLPPNPDLDNPAYNCVRPGAHGVLAGRRDGKVDWFDPTGGQRARWAVFPDQQVSALAVRGDGTEALAGGSNGAVARLALPSGEVTRFAEAPHFDAVTATAYLDGGATLTASADHAVRLWGGRGQLLLTLHEGGPIVRAEVSPQGELILLVRSEWGLRVWDLAELRERLIGLGIEPGFAVAQKSTPAAAPLTGLVTEVFKGQQFKFLAERRRDPNIDFDWGLGPASPFVGRDDFSIRWTGRLRAPAPGKWKIQINCDDDATVWIDGRRVLTVPASDVPSATTIDLPAHPVSIRVDYRELRGLAHCQLLWRKLGEFPWVPVPPAAFTPD
ncbi:MAG: PA14 domain-containing protein [Gemmataceae bacterium]